MLTRLTLWLCLSVALGGCAGTVDRFTQEAEGGPVAISGYPTVLHPQHRVAALDPAFLELEQDYLREPVPLALAVSVDGDFGGYWRCKRVSNCSADVATVARRVIEYCEGMVLGGACVLHSLGTRRIDPAAAAADFAVIPFNPIEGRPLAGPAQADGLLVYLPGFWGWADKANDRPRLDNATGFPLLDALDDRGWDVVRVNIPYLRRLQFYEDADHWRALLDGFAERARAQGYARVSFLGYSRGGAELLGALSAGGRYDGAAVIEPDRRGPKFRANGDLRISDKDRLADLAALSPPADGATPLLFAHFAKSRWFGALDASELTQAVRTSERVIVLNRPAGFASHYAGGAPAFAARYSDCVDAVLRGRDPGVSCDAADTAQASADPSLGAHLEAAGFATLDGDSLQRRLSSAVYCQERPDAISGLSDDACIASEDGLVVAGPHSGDMTPFIERSDADWDATGLCAYWYDNVDAPRCYDVYEDGEGLWIVDRRTDHVFGRYATRPGVRMPPAEWVCRSFRGRHGDPACDRTRPSTS